LDVVSELEHGGLSQDTISNIKHDMHPQQRPIKRLEDLEKYPASYEKKPLWKACGMLCID
jgi:hypothetical protein